MVYHGSQHVGFTEFNTGLEGSYFTANKDYAEEYYWTTFLEDKNNTIWEAKLNVANTTNGEKILYDIDPIKKMGRAIELDTSPSTNSIRKESENVNSDEKVVKTDVIKY